MGYGMTQLPILPTESEAAEYFGVTELTLYRWRKAGRIGFYMVGKSPKFSEAHIAEFLTAQTVPAVQAEPKQPKESKRRRSESRAGALAQAHAILKAARERRGG